jgi:phosphoribosylformylglycinamidine (FGAM) synthase-like amidotransferase family enzyme
MKTALDNFFKKENTLTVEICNVCQLLMELEKIHPEMDFLKNLFGIKTNQKTHYNTLLNLHK